MHIQREVTRLCSPDDKRFPVYKLCRAILDVSQAHGADHQKLLRGTGLFDSDLQQHRLMSANQLAGLLNNAEKLTSSRNLGLQIGHSLITSYREPFTRGFGYCNTLGYAMKLIQPFIFALLPLVDVGVYHRPDSVLLTLKDALGSSRQFATAADIFCSALIATIKQWLAQRISLSFDFPFERPRNIADFETHLGRQLRFNQPAFTIKLERAALSLPLPNANAHLLRAHFSYARQTLPRDLFLPQFIRRAVTLTPGVSASQIADKLSISPATLKRKLKTFNVTFSQLADEQKCEQAIYLLKICQLTNEQSAVSMAISDLTNFRRAVKRWTGLTPSELRGY